MEVTEATIPDALIYAREAFIDRFAKRIPFEQQVVWRGIQGVSTELDDEQRGALISVVFSAGDVGLGQLEMSVIEHLVQHGITPLIFFCTGDIDESDGATMIVFAKTLLNKDHISAEPRCGDENDLRMWLSETLKDASGSLSRGRASRFEAERRRIEGVRVVEEIRGLQDRIAAHWNARLRCDAISKHGVELERSIDAVLAKAIAALSEQALQQQVRLRAEEELKHTEEAMWPAQLEEIAHATLRRWQLSKVENMLLDIQNVFPVDVDLASRDDEVGSTINATLRAKTVSDHVGEGTVTLSVGAGMTTAVLVATVIPVLAAIPIGLAAAAYVFHIRSQKSTLSQFLTDNGPDLSQATHSTFVVTQGALRQTAEALHRDIRARTAEAIKVILSDELLSDAEAQLAAKRLLALQQTGEQQALHPARDA